MDKTLRRVRAVRDPLEPKTLGCAASAAAAALPQASPSHPRFVLERNLVLMFLWLFRLVDECTKDRLRPGTGPRKKERAAPKDSAQFCMPMEFCLSRCMIDAAPVEFCGQGAGAAVGIAGSASADNPEIKRVGRRQACRRS